MSEHSRLFSPSGASRWLNCPGSAELCADVVEKTNVHAERGTMLHDFCEHNFERDIIDYTVLPKGDQVDAENAIKMARDLQAYCGTACSFKLEAKVVVPGAEECFGTADLVFYNKDTKHLVVGDYKFGYGHVEAEMNPQLLIYAMGATKLFPDQLFETISLAVIQPKSDGQKADIFTLKMTELGAWYKDVLCKAYEAIKGGTTDCTPGEKQCLWCKVKASCPAVQNEVMDALNNEAPHDELTIAELLPKLKMIRSWCDAVEAEAMGRMEEGEKIPGYKLVRKRGRRRWIDVEKAEHFLALRKIPVDQRRVYKVIGIPEAERLMKSLQITTKVSNSFKKLIEKPEAGLTYATLGDKRPEVDLNPAEELLGASLLDEIL